MFSRKAFSPLATTVLLLFLVIVTFLNLQGFFTGFTSNFYYTHAYENTTHAIFKVHVISLNNNILTLKTGKNVTSIKFHITDSNGTKLCTGFNGTKIDGLLGQWSFDNNLLDSSGGDNHARDSTSVTFNSTASVGSHSAQFSGNQHLNISNINFTGGMTIAAWMRFDNLTSDQVLIGSDKTGEEELEVWMDEFGGSDRFGYSIYNAGWNSDYGSTTLNPLTWYFVTATSNGSTGELYVNGIDQGVSMTSLSIPDSNSGDLLIGELYSGAKDMNGLIDELMIFDNALNLTQIADLYAKKFIIQSPGESKISVSDCLLTAGSIYKIVFITPEKSFKEFLVRAT